MYRYLSVLFRSPPSVSSRLLFVNKHVSCRGREGRGHERAREGVGEGRTDGRDGRTDDGGEGGRAPHPARSPASQPTRLHPSIHLASTDRPCPPTSQPRCHAASQPCTHCMSAHARRARLEGSTGTGTVSSVPVLQFVPPGPRKRAVGVVAHIQHGSADRCALSVEQVCA